MDIQTIVPIVSAALIAIGLFWAKWHSSKKLVRELAELLLAIANAAEDDKLTASELRIILGEAKDVARAIKNVVA